MANEQNLIPQAHILTVEEASRGGKASAKARAEKKAFRDYMDSILAETGGKLNGRDATKKEIISARAVQIMLTQDVDVKEFLEAFRVVRDTIGEKPVEKVEQVIEDRSLDRLRSDFGYGLPAGESPDSE